MTMKLDTIEAFTNAAIGLMVSWLASVFVLGYTAVESVAVTAMFFALSFSRSWILRRLFRGFGA
jgi:hypothetical protein